MSVKCKVVMLCFHRLFRLQNPRRWGGKTFIFDFILIFRKHRTPRRSSPDLPDSCQNFKFHFPGGLESGIKIWSHFPLQTACRCKGLESINCEILLSSLFDHHSPRHQHYFHMHLYLNQDLEDRGKNEVKKNSCFVVFAINAITIIIIFIFHCTFA